MLALQFALRLLVQFVLQLALLIPTIVRFTLVRERHLLVQETVLVPAQALVRVLAPEVLQLPRLNRRRARPFVRQYAVPAMLVQPAQLVPMGAQFTLVIA